MSAIEVKARAKRMIDGLSGARLRAAAEFLEFVSLRETDRATVELLGIPGFERSFATGKREVAAGKTRGWREVMGRGVASRKGGKHV